MAGARWTPGRHKTGGEVHSLSHQAHYLALFPAVFWDFGSLYQGLAGCLWSAVAPRSNLGPCLRREWRHEEVSHQPSHLTENDNSYRSVVCESMKPVQFEI